MSPYFRKYISYDGQLFFENVQNLMQISELKKKTQKNIFYLESLDLNWLRKIVSIRQRILVIGTECVKNSHNILHITKSDFFKHNILIDDQ